MIQPLSYISRAALGIAASFALVSAPQAQNDADLMETSTSYAPAHSIADLTPQNSEFCAGMMAGFPDDSLINRYQFFRLIQSMKAGVDSDMRAAFTHYGEKTDMGQTGVVETIENLSDPVVLQSSPAYALTNASHLIRYAEDCSPFIASQISSIEFAEPSVTEAAMEEVLAEDAVYLRALVMESLESLSAQNHPIYGPATERYEGATIYIRNEGEFIGFEAELEALTNDTIAEIDDKLALHLQMVEGDIDKETVSTSSDMLESMNRTSKQESHRGVYETLFRILNSPY